MQDCPYHHFHPILILMIVLSMLHPINGAEPCRLRCCSSWKCCVFIAFMANIAHSIWLVLKSSTNHLGRNLAFGSYFWKYLMSSSLCLLAYIMPACNLRQRIEFYIRFNNEKYSVQMFKNKIVIKAITNLTNLLLMKIVSDNIFYKSTLCGINWWNVNMLKKRIK